MLRIYLGDGVAIAMHKHAVVEILHELVQCAELRARLLQPIGERRHAGACSAFNCKILVTKKTGKITYFTFFFYSFIQTIFL